MHDSTVYEAQLRAQGYPEIYIRQCVAEHEIAREMEAIGRHVARVADSVKQWGGDHDYDGIVNYIWRGIHQAHGIEDRECGIHWPSSDCPLDAGYGRERKPSRKKLSTKQSLDVFAKDDYTCRHCGTKENLTVDHIVPVVKGGTNDPDNLQTLCGSCNSRKGAR